MKLSFICVYNNKKILNDHLIKTLELQTFESYEYIFIDNTSGKYNNAGTALNYGTSKAKGKYLVFLHQDIDFLGTDSIERLIIELERNQPFGIAGLAGVDYTGKIYANFLQGSNFLPAGINFYNSISVESLDECFFVIPKSIWEKYRLWEESWHLYAVEYCLRMKLNGLKVIALPCNIIYHLSPGNSLNRSYYVTMRKLAAIYRKRFRYIYTTIRGEWPTSLLRIYIKTTVVAIKNLLRKTI